MPPPRRTSARRATRPISRRAARRCLLPFPTSRLRRRWRRPIQGDAALPVLAPAVVEAAAGRSRAGAGCRPQANEEELKALRSSSEEEQKGGGSRCEAKGRSTTSAWPRRRRFAQKKAEDDYRAAQAREGTLRPRGGAREGTLHSRGGGGEEERRSASASVRKS